MVTWSAARQTVVFSLGVLMGHQELGKYLSALTVPEQPLVRDSLQHVLRQTVITVSVIVI